MGEVPMGQTSRSVRIRRGLVAWVAAAAVLTGVGAAAAPAGAAVSTVNLTASKATTVRGESVKLSATVPKLAGKPKATFKLVG